MDADPASPYTADGLCQLDGMPGSGLLQVSVTDEDPSVPQVLDSYIECQLLEDTQTIRPQDGGCFDTSTDLSSSSSPSSVTAWTPRHVDDQGLQLEEQHLWLSQHEQQHQWSYQQPQQQNLHPQLHMQAGATSPSSPFNSHQPQSQPKGLGTFFGLGHSSSMQVHPTTGSNTSSPGAMLPPPDLAVRGNTQNPIPLTALMTAQTPQQDSSTGTTQQDATITALQQLQLQQQHLTAHDAYTAQAPPAAEHAHHSPSLFAHRPGSSTHAHDASPDGHTSSNHSLSGDGPDMDDPYGRLEQGAGGAGARRRRYSEYQMPPRCRQLLDIALANGGNARTLTPAMLLHNFACRANLQLTFESNAIGVNGPFAVEAKLAPGAHKRRPAILVGGMSTITATGRGQSKQQARQYACTELLELLLQVMPADLVLPNRARGALLGPEPGMPGDLAGYRPDTAGPARGPAGAGAIMHEVPLHHMQQLQLQGSPDQPPQQVYYVRALPGQQQAAGQLMAPPPPPYPRRDLGPQHPAIARSRDGQQPRMQQHLPGAGSYGGRHQQQQQQQQRAGPWPAAGSPVQLHGTVPEQRYYVVPAGAAGPQGYQQQRQQQAAVQYSETGFVPVQPSGLARAQGPVRQQQQQQQQVRLMSQPAAGGQHGVQWYTTAAAAGQMAQQGQGLQWYTAAGAPASAAAAAAPAAPLLVEQLPDGTLVLLGQQGDYVGGQAVEMYQPSAAGEQWATGGVEQGPWEGAQVPVSYAQGYGDGQQQQQQQQQQLYFVQAQDDGTPYWC